MKCVTLVKHNQITSGPSDLMENPVQEYAVKIYEKKLIEKPPLSIPASSIGEPGQEGITYKIVNVSAESPVYAGNMNARSAKKDSVRISNEVLDEEFDDEEIIDVTGEDN